MTSIAAGTHVAAALALVTIIVAGCSSSAPATVHAWASGGGNASVQALQTDVANINSDGDNSSYTAMVTDCTRLGSDVTTAQRLGPVPDDAIQQKWSTALGDLSTGATECLAAAQNNPGVQQGVSLTFAFSALDQARAELAIAAAAIQAQE